MSSLAMGERHRVNFAIAQADLLAPNSFEIICPVDGFVQGLGVIVQAAVTTGGTIKVTGNNTDVAGAQVTVANSAAKGTIVKADATPADASRAVKKGDRIRVTPAGFATAGAVNGYVEFATGF